MIEQDVDVLFRYLIGRTPTGDEAASLAGRLAKGEIRPLQLVYELLASAEHTQNCAANVLELHLYLMHHARVRIAARLLPPAARIVDLGGGSLPLYALGYPHPFEEMIVVDLPREDRCEMYRDIEFAQPAGARGRVALLSTDMKDLGAIQAGTIDLVYAGESIEHVSEEDSVAVYREVRRVLRPGGAFCLDTPNRNVTEIHIDGAGWIHPEHKIEYRPEHLQRNLVAAGFDIVEAFGLCPMLSTWREKRFDYGDFLCHGITTDVESAYLQYYRCAVRS